VRHPSRVLLLSFSRYGAHRDRHSFPTRRSSDLETGVERDPYVPRPNGVWSVSPCTTSMSSMGSPSSLLMICANVVSCPWPWVCRSEEHTSELQSRENLVCRLLLEKKKTNAECCH